MAVNQAGLSYLLSVSQSKSFFNRPGNKNEGIIKKLNKGTDSYKDNSNCNNNNKYMQLLRKLQEKDKAMQETLYERMSLKLRLEGLRREEMTTSNLRKKDRILAEQECILYHCSMRKLLSASQKNSGIRLGTGDLNIKSCESSENNILEKADEISSDIKESVRFGIEAAEVARRRKNNQIKEAIEAAAKKSAAKREKNRKRWINARV